MLSVIFGLVGIVVGISWLISWGGWSFFLTVLQGSVPPFLILVGLIAVAAGVSSIKDNIAAKKEEEKEGGEESAESSESTSSKEETSTE